METKWQGTLLWNQALCCNTNQDFLLTDAVPTCVYTVNDIPSNSDNHMLYTIMHHHPRRWQGLDLQNFFLMHWTWYISFCLSPYQRILFINVQLRQNRPQTIDLQITIIIILQFVSYHSHLFWLVNKPNQKQDWSELIELQEQYSLAPCG